MVIRSYNHGCAEDSDSSNDDDATQLTTATPTSTSTATTTALTDAADTETDSWEVCPVASRDGLDLVPCGYAAQSDVSIYLLIRLFNWLNELDSAQYIIHSVANSQNFTPIFSSSVNVHPGHTLYSHSTCTMSTSQLIQCSFGTTLHPKHRWRKTLLMYAMPVPKRYSFIGRHWTRSTVSQNGIAVTRADILLLPD